MKCTAGYLVTGIEPFGRWIAALDRLQDLKLVSICDSIGHTSRGQVCDFDSKLVRVHILCSCLLARVPAGVHITLVWRSSDWDYPVSVRRVTIRLHRDVSVLQMDTPSIFLVPRRRAIEKFCFVDVTAKGLDAILVHLILTLFLVAIEFVAPYLISA